MISLTSPPKSNKLALRLHLYHGTWEATHHRWNRAGAPCPLIYIVCSCIALSFSPHTHTSLSLHTPTLLSLQASPPLASTSLPNHHHQIITTMKLTTLILAAICAATLTIATPVAVESVPPPPRPGHFDCQKCKVWEDECRKVS